MGLTTITLNKRAHRTKKQCDAVGQWTYETKRKRLTKLSAKTVATGAVWDKHMTAVNTATTSFCRRNESVLARASAWLVSSAIFFSIQSHWRAVHFIKSIVFPAYPWFAECLKGKGVNEFWKCAGEGIRRVVVPPWCRLQGLVNKVLCILRSLSNFQMIERQWSESMVWHYSRWHYGN
jgi:hypothetical protein